MNNRILPEREETQTAKKQWWKYLLNFHVFFLFILIVIILVIIFRFFNWGTRIDSEEYFKHNELISDGADSYDVFMPLLDENGNLLANKSPHSILFFGNSVFADDRDSKDNVVNMIAERTGATVYNCSVGGSYLTAKNFSVKETSSGLDVYNFYFLVLYLVLDPKPNSFSWLETNPDADIFPETQEVRRTLDTIDMSTVDTIAILYDGSDYLAGHCFYNPEDPTDVTSFTGNLEAGIELLQKFYPHVRIIVMSPTYAFGVGDNGEYISSDIKRYGGGETLSSFTLRECESTISHNVTFVDNLYGTFNEDEAPDYLKDNLHLNQEGREKVVKRFIHALTYYDH